MTKFTDIPVWFPVSESSIYSTFLNKEIGENTGLARPSAGIGRVPVFRESGIGRVYCTGSTQAQDSS
ncbi:hypothetical protein DPMN_101061 [Dreissena polymorpha]|uniref:Uncharacterized protein n=1 Tax=Dreissena polymorpha TaxID=45954 RepID=A0A9D4LIQ8_DREPO|nr:hypothetical protein DPMN_101061 [Dreissena polymorpha]